MKTTFLLLAFLLPALSFAQSSEGRHHNRGLSVEVYRGNLYINERLVPGCVKSATESYRFGEDHYVFAIGCDNHPYYYSTAINRISIITTKTEIKQIYSAETHANGIIYLRVRGTGGSVYSVKTKIYVEIPRPPRRGYNYTATQSGNRLFIDEVVVEGCVKRITDVYRFGGQYYTFIVGCDNFPYYYASGMIRIRNITKRTEISRIYIADVNVRGEIYLRVQGTGGSIYNVGTALYEY